MSGSSKLSNCFFCDFTTRPALLLRGLSLCLTERFDTRYKWTELVEDGKFVLRGYEGGSIVWDGAVWRVTGKAGFANNKSSYQ